jgi:DNA-directed RNA polymerase subunit RPC12/RpoP
MNNEIKCPQCGSTQLSADKKGFSGKKAVAGAVLTGGIGVLAGTIGSNKILLSCLSCGKQFQPGNDLDAINEKTKQQQIKNEKIRSSPFYKIFMKIILIILGLLILMIILFNIFDVK